MHGEEGDGDFAEKRLKMLEVDEGWSVKVEDEEFWESLLEVTDEFSEISERDKSAGFWWFLRECPTNKNLVSLHYIVG